MSHQNFSQPQQIGLEGQISLCCGQLFLAAGGSMGWLPAPLASIQYIPVAWPLASPLMGHSEMSLGIDKCPEDMGLATLS